MNEGQNLQSVIISIKTERDNQPGKSLKEIQVKIAKEFTWVD